MQKVDSVFNLQNSLKRILRTEKRARFQPRLKYIFIKYETYLIYLPYKVWIILNTKF